MSDNTTPTNPPKCSKPNGTEETQSVSKETIVPAASSETNDETPSSAGPDANTTNITQDGDVQNFDAPMETEEIKQPRISEDNIPTFRILRKLAKSLIRAQYNHSTLDTSLQEKRLPKGLCPNKIPLKIPEVSTKTQIAWEHAHNNLNKQLTTILRDHWKERITILQEDYDNTLITIQENSTPEELQHIKSLIHT